VRDDQVAPPGDDPVEPEEPQGNLRPTQPGVIVGWAVAGLVLGWALHPVSDRMGRVPPLVTWGQPLALVLLAAILAYVAWSTWRTVHVRRERLLPHQAVNRLVLARACALVAALVAGGYLGYGLSWIGDSAEMADERLWRSVAGAASGVLGVVAALLLERACRIRNSGNTK
jgi:MFS family permease